MKETELISRSNASVLIDPIVQILQDLNEKNAATNLLEALGRHAFTLQELDSIARNFSKIKEFKLSLVYAKKCHEEALKTDIPEVISTSLKNMIHCYNSINEGENALSLIESLENDYSEFFDNDAKIQKSFALFICNRKDEAQKVLEEIIEYYKDKIKDDVYDSAMFNMAAHEFRHGEFLAGMSKFIVYGRKKNTNLKSQLPFNPWVGQKIKNVILSSEAGIGDEFVNVRFLQRFKERGMKAYWYTDRKEVHEFFKKNGFDVVTKEQLFSFDKKDTACINAMEAPLQLRLSLNELYRGDYINYPRNFIDKSGSDKIKVGLRWAGNNQYEHDLHRTIPIDDLFFSIYDENVSFYSLQRDTNMEFIESLKYNVFNIHDLSADGTLQTIESTCNAMINMDLVITSCTSIAHMAASMGIETWVLVPIAAYYVWAYPRKVEGKPYFNTHWYGKNVKVFQQTKPRVWDDVIENVKTEFELYKIGRTGNIL